MYICNLGAASGRIYPNESVYSSGVGKVISQLEIYDQVWAARKLDKTVQKEDGGVRHSQQ